VERIDAILATPSLTYRDGLVRAAEMFRLELWPLTFGEQRAVDAIIAEADKVKGEG